MKCCVYTRSFNEDPYLPFFIEHYLSIGFDEIIILKSDKIKIDVSQYNNKVIIHYVDNIENRLLPVYSKKINRNNDWVLSVDIDEILLIKNFNIKEYISNIINFDKDVNIIYFRWAILEKYDNTNINNLKDLIDNYKIYQNSHIKSMAKVKYLKSVWHPHLIDLKIPHHIYFEKSILKVNKPSKHNISLVSYYDSILLHIHTRSLNNLLIKSLTTKLGFSGRNKIVKRIKDSEKFPYLINEKINDDFFQNFKKIIGEKAILPFNHSKTKTINIEELGYNINFYENDIVNISKEENILFPLLIKNNINIKEYYNKCDTIFNLVKSHFRK
tara:strand:+ start:322 stop:1305 length:984 start_codon:yes stop_codon:yes gene_type:complete